MTRPTGQARAAGWSAAALTVLALAALAANFGPAALGFAVIAVLAALLALAVLIAALDTLVDGLLLEDPTDSYAERARQAWRADLHPEVLVGVVIDPATNPLNLGRTVQPMIHN